MKRLIEMIKEYQDINVVEKGISFAEEGFTQLYEEVLNANEQRVRELKIVGGAGILVGATSVGLVTLGVKGYTKLREREVSDRFEDEKEEEVAKDTTPNEQYTVRRSFNVGFKTDDGGVDRVIVNAYDPIDAMSQVSSALEEGMAITITDVSEV